MCGATQGGLSLDGIDVAKEAVVQGQVLRDGEPVASAYVRLLDRTGEFTAEVPTSATGHFRFFAGNGEWTARSTPRWARSPRSPSASDPLLAPWIPASPRAAARGFVASPPPAVG